MSFEERAMKIIKRNTAKGRVCAKLFDKASDYESYEYLLNKAESSTALSFVDVEKFIDISEKGSVAA